MNRSRLAVAAFALWYFLSGMAFLFVLLAVFDVEPRRLILPGGAPAVRGPFWHEGVVDGGSLAERVSRPRPIDESRSNAIIDAIGNVSPTVVSIGIVVERRYISPGYSDYWNYFFRRDRSTQRFYPKIGTGFIIHEDGLIVTNQHVIEGGERVVVTLQDGREVEGEVIGAHRTLDIAVIRINGHNLPCAPLGDSEDLIIGEWAIAIGNPFGSLLRDNRPTVTVGVISAVNRQFRGSAEEGRYYQNMIQTDAAINPGNSGGPLVNSRGEVVGVNTFIFSQSGGSIGLGFAIPIDTVKSVVREILTHGRVRDVWLGFQGQEISTLTARALGLRSTEGVIVTHVESGSPADEAGLQRGDVILEMDGLALRGASDANAKIRSLQVGERLELSVEREGRRLVITITAADRP